MAVCEFSVEESIKNQLVARIVALEDLLRKEKEEHEETKQQLLKATNDYENAANDLSWAALSNRKLREERHLVRQLARSEQKQLQDHLNDTFKTIHRLREDQFQLNEKIRSLEDFDKDAEISRLKVALEESKRKQVPESEVQRRLKDEINDVRSMMDSIILRECETQAYYEGRINEQQAQIHNLMQQQTGEGQILYQQMYPEVPEQFPGQFNHVVNDNNGWVHPYDQQPPVYAAADDIHSEKSSGSWQVENLPASDQEENSKPLEDAGDTEAAENAENTKNTESTP